MARPHHHRSGRIGRQARHRNTWLSADFIVGLLGHDWSEADILRNYPGITHDDIAACLRYASEVLKAGKVYPMPRTA